MAAVVIAMTPAPPYYVAVITVEREQSDDGYFEMADAMDQLAKAQPGFLGMEWARSGCYGLLGCRLPAARGGLAALGGRPGPPGGGAGGPAVRPRTVLPCLRSAR